VAAGAFATAQDAAAAMVRTKTTIRPDSATAATYAALAADYVRLYEALRQTRA
jgi:sugar (pentulose or hexulose) kinase